MPLGSQIRVIMMMALALACVACTSDIQVSPKAENGVLDLSGWNFERDGTVKLTGEWLFEWQEFNQPTGTKSPSHYNQTLIDVPAAWRHYPDPTRSSSNLPLTGFATYKLRVILPADTNTEDLGFSASLITTAASWGIWSEDGSEILATAQQGKPGRNEKETIPRFIESSTALTSTSTPAIIVVAHVSNFHHARGGIHKSPVLGQLTSIETAERSKLLVAGLTLGICIIIGLYHLIIFLQQREDIASLLFAAFCGAMALRELTTSRVLEMLGAPLSQETFSLILSLEYSSIPLLLVTGGYFIHSQVPARSFKLFLDWIVALPACALLVFPVLTTSLVYSDYVFLYEVQFVLTALAGAAHLLRHITDKHSLARWTFLAFAILAGGGVHDTPGQLQLIQTGYIAPYTFAAFIVLQSAILSERSARAFREAGTLALRNVEQEEILNQERNQRALAERSLHLELHTKVNLIANAIHHLNNPLNHIQGSMYLTQNEQTQLKTFINSLMPDNSEDPIVIAAQEQVDKHFDAIESSRHSIQDALSRASNSVTMLRALSQLDGVCYNNSNIREVWRILVQRTSLPLNTINHDGIKKNGTTSLVGHPALYAHAMELIFDFLWDALPDPNKLQISFTTAVQADSDYHEVRIQFASAQPTIAESCSELTEQIVYLLKPYQCGLTVHSDHADLSIRARQIPESEMPKPFELI